MSIPLFVDGETDLDATSLNRLVDAGNSTVGPLANLRATRRSILDFGGLGDGNHDNWEAWQYAQYEMGSLEGGVLEFPDGDFYIGQREVSSGLYTALSMNYNDIWLRGNGARTRIVTDQDSFLIWTHGGSTNGRGFVNGYPEGLYIYLPTYDINTAARGALSITCTDPADAGAFQPGDRVRIYTGQVAPASTNEPDAETNIVVSAATDTGIVRLAHPLRKSYQQEYYVSGTNGYSSRNVTANPAPWGIQNVSDYILRNCWITDMTLESSAAKSMIRGDQVENFHLERCTLRCAATPESLSNIYGGRFLHNRIYIQDAGVSISPLTAATGSSDIVFGYNTIFADTAEAVQINEGCTGVLYIGNEHYVGAQSADAPSVAVGQRGRNIRIVLNTFNNAGNGSVVKINSSYDKDVAGTGGIVALNTFTGGNWPRPIEVDCPGWQIAHNLYQPDSGYGTYQSFDYTYGSGQPEDRKFLRAWLDKDHQEVTLGPLPINAYILAVHMHALVAFNSDGTDTVSIGTDDNHTRFSNAVDVSSPGVLSPTLATAGFRPANYTVKAFYTNGGTEPSAGKVLVMIEYVLAPSNP